MACELYLGGRGGVWRSPDMDAGAAFTPELEMAVHPLAGAAPDPLVSHLRMVPR